MSTSASPVPPRAESETPHRVLLVDDQAMVGEAVRRLLEDQPGFLFHHCPHPLEAIRQAESFHPTVILLDLKMPEVDGLTLLRYMRVHPRLKGVPVVMLSVREEPEVKAQAFSHGANDYLIKLPQREELVARLAYHSRHGQLERERDLALRELEANQERLRLLTEAAFEGIAVSRGMIIQDVNPAFAQLFGRSPQDLVGVSLLTLVDDGCHALVERLMAANSQEPVEVRGLAREGGAFTGEMRVRPLALGEGGGEPLRMIAIRDVTDWKRMVRELREAQREAERATRAKSAFLATMSHEIRTPMNVIVGMGELLQESELAPEQQRYVEISQRAGHTLLALINDMLDLSKIEAGRLILEEHPFDLREVLEDVQQLLALRAQDKGLRLEFSLDPRLPARVRGDANRLRQVLLNLVGNAVKFTQRGGVSVHLLPAAGEMLHCQVRDSGIGIPRELHQQIFQPYVQAGPGTTRHYGGTGLGLTICRHLVERMGGELWLESEPGAGSTFHFTARLPRAEATTTEEDADRTPPQPAAERRPLHILLVDDSADSRLLIRAFLKRSGDRLSEAGNGQEGVEMFRQHPYDLVLMDVEMPVLDGLQATRAIRDWERRQDRPPTPVIALSAHAMKEDTQRILAAGCDHHLIKPIQKSRLLAELARWQ